MSENELGYGITDRDLQARHVQNTTLEDIDRELILYRQQAHSSGPGSIKTALLAFGIACVIGATFYWFNAKDVKYMTERTQQTEQH